MRDLRIDFFRGLALCAIFLNHVPTPATLLTWRAYGFSDAADLFVFLAGFSAALAWSQGFLKDGLSASLKAARRAFVLYKAHLCIVAALLAVALLTVRLTGDAAVLDWMALEHLARDPVDGWLRVATLSYLPTYGDILPMYVVFIGGLALLGPLIVRQPAAALLLSVLLWLVAGRYGLAPAGRPDGTGWFFNPFCWQLLFVLGFVLGQRARRGVALPRHPLLAAAAAAVVLYAFLAVSPWQRFGYAPGFVLFDPDLLPPHGKSMLEIGRLLHFLALAYLCAWAIPPQARWLSRGPAALFLLMGRHSLPVFSVGIVLSTVWTVLVVATPTTPGLEIVFALSGLPILVAVALMRELDARQEAGAADAGAGTAGPEPARPTPAGQRVAGQTAVA